jgi:hypothetical protein
MEEARQSRPPPLLKNLRCVLRSVVPGAEPKGHHTPAPDHWHRDRQKAREGQRGTADAVVPSLIVSNFMEVTGHFPMTSLEVGAEGTWWPPHSRISAAGR